MQTRAFDESSVALIGMAKEQKKKYSSYYLSGPFTGSSTDRPGHSTKVDLRRNRRYGMVLQGSVSHTWKSGPDEAGAERSRARPSRAEQSRSEPSSVLSLRSASRELINALSCCGHEANIVSYTGVTLPLEISSRIPSRSSLFINRSILSGELSQNKNTTLLFELLFSSFRSLFARLCQYKGDLNARKKLNAF